jgi:hypothetical protein
MMLRWVAAGILEAVKRFRRLKGYADMPTLIAPYALAIVSSGWSVPEGTARSRSRLSSRRRIFNRRWDIPGIELESALAAFARRCSS